MALVWRYLIAPFLYPVLSLPMSLIGFIARPFQLVLILVLTGLLQVHVGLAGAFVAASMLFYGYHVFVPPRNQIVALKWWGTYGQTALRLPMFVFTASLLVIFLLSFWMMPPFHPVVRWFASLGLAYYVAGVVSGYVTLLSMRQLD